MIHDINCILDIISFSTKTSPNPCPTDATKTTAEPNPTKPRTAEPSTTKPIDVNPNTKLVPPATIHEYTTRTITDKEIRTAVVGDQVLLEALCYLFLSYLESESRLLIF